MKSTFNEVSLKRCLAQSLFAAYSLAMVFYIFAYLFSSFDREWAKSHLGILGLAGLFIFSFFFLLSWIFERRLIRPAALTWMIVGTIVFFLSLVVSFLVTDFSFQQLFDEEGTAGAVRLFSGLFHVNWAVFPEAVVEAFETVFVAFLATAISVPLSFILAFFGAKNLVKRPLLFVVYAIIRTVLNVTRSIEPLIWAVIFSVWVGIGPFAGMLALLIHSVASLTKQYSEIIESVDEGPIDGIRATGASPVQVVWFGIVPQVLLPYIAFTFYRWDINVRMATVIGLAGGGGIGTLLIKYQGQALWPEVGCIIVVIAAIVWIMDTASAYVREGLK